MNNADFIKSLHEQDRKVTALKAQLCALKKRFRFAQKVLNTSVIEFVNENYPDKLANMIQPLRKGDVAFKVVPFYNVKGSDGKAHKCVLGITFLAGYEKNGSPFYSDWDAKYERIEILID